MAARIITLSLRVNEDEDVMFEEMARLGKLPLGTFIRRHLLFEAEQRGIVPRYSEKHNRAAMVSEARDAIVV